MRPKINRIDQTKLQLAKNKLSRFRGATPIAGNRATTLGSTPDTPGTSGTSYGSGLSRPSFSSRSLIGTPLDFQHGGRESVSSSDDEEENLKNTNDKDSDLDEPGEGKGYTGDGDETKEGEAVDQTYKDILPRKFTELNGET